MANTYVEQLRRNAVALISLVVAISSLSYNTWRNEATEDNRNLRFAAFEILLKLGELQQVVFHVHFDKDLDKGNPRVGWAYVLTINDLAKVLPVTCRRWTPRAARPTCCCIHWNKRVNYHLACSPDAAYAYREKVRPGTGREAGLGHVAGSAMQEQLPSGIREGWLHSRIMA